MARAGLLLYGLQRSGTNLLEQELRRRFRVRVLNEPHDRTAPGQKHFRLYDDKSRTPHPDYVNDYRFSGFGAFEAALPRPADHYVLISKDPYSWLASYKTWAARCSWVAPDYPYIDEWVLFYGAWRRFAEEPDGAGRIHFLRYIDLLADSEKVFTALGKRLGLAGRVRLPWQRGPRRLLGKVPQSARFTAGRARRYLEKEYLADYSAADLEQINACLDPVLMAALGYEMEASPAARTEGSGRRRSRASAAARP